MIFEVPAEACEANCTDPAPVIVIVLAPAVVELPKLNDPEPVQLIVDDSAEAESLNVPVVPSPREILAVPAFVLALKVRSLPLLRVIVLDDAVLVFVSVGFPNTTLLVQNY